jgi:hypothetical protein
MASIRPCDLPHAALLAAYRGNGNYADCYFADVPWTVPHDEYVAAFYTTPVFKLERLALSWLGKLPSTDEQARLLAAGTLDRFAAWTVEGRSTDQLLMCDLRGHTRSWLMVESLGAAGTRLYFGSAVVPRTNRETGQKEFSRTFHALLGFHKVYSRVLLRAAKSRLMRTRPAAALTDSP